MPDFCSVTRKKAFAWNHLKKKGTPHSSIFSTQRSDCGECHRSWIYFLVYFRHTNPAGFTFPDGGETCARSTVSGSLRNIYLFIYTYTFHGREERARKNGSRRCRSERRLCGSFGHRFLVKILPRENVNWDVVLFCKCVGSGSIDAYLSSSKPVTYLGRGKARGGNWEGTLAMSGGIKLLSEN